jgi:hypothetical protein
VDDSRHNLNAERFAAMTIPAGSISRAGSRNPLMLLERLGGTICATLLMWSTNHDRFQSMSFMKRTLSQVVFQLNWVNL